MRIPTSFSGVLAAKSFKIQGDPDQIFGSLLSWREHDGDCEKSVCVHGLGQAQRFFHAAYERALLCHHAEFSGEEKSYQLMIHLGGKICPPDVELFHWG